MLITHHPLLPLPVRRGGDAALVTAAVTLVVSTTLKIGIRAWCRYYADRHPEVEK